MGKKGLFFICLCLIAAAKALAVDDSVLQHDVARELYAVVRDGQGQGREGLLRFQTDRLHVETRDRQEKWIPVRSIRSITLEKSPTDPTSDPFQQETAYVVRVENSQEIFALKDKYSFSLNTQLGLVTQDIDPELVKNLFSRERPAVPDKPLFQDKSIVIKIEIKF